MGFAPVLASIAPPGRVDCYWEFRWFRSRTRFTTEEAEGTRGGRWVGEQANFCSPFGTLRLHHL